MESAKSAEGHCRTEALKKIGRLDLSSFFVFSSLASFANACFLWVVTGRSAATGGHASPIFIISVSIGRCANLRALVSRKLVAFGCARASRMRRPARVPAALPLMRTLFSCAVFSLSPCGPFVGGHRAIIPSGKAYLFMQMGQAPRPSALFNSAKSEASEADLEEGACRTKHYRLSSL